MTPWPIRMKQNVTYGITLHQLDELTDLGALIIAVPHRMYGEMALQEFVARLTPQGCLVDVKSILDPDEVKKTGIQFWRL